MVAKSGTGLVGFASILFVILSIIDSIVHLVKNKDNEKETWKINLTIVLMVVRLLASIQFIAFLFVSKKYSLKSIYIILSSFFYSLCLTVVMVLSCLVIDFKESSISLICHIIASSFGLTFSLKLLVIKFEAKKSIFARALKIYSENQLAISTLFSVILAVILGIILRDANPGWNGRSIKYIGFIGELFLRMLKCLVLPLIFSSLVYAMGDIDTNLFGKIGLRTVAYYLGTTILSIVLGILLVLTIKPGERSQTEPNSGNQTIHELTTADTILDLIRNLFPENIVEASFRSYKTVLTVPEGQNPNETDINNWNIGSGKNENMNILGIVVFSIVFGVIIGQMKENGKILAEFFKAFNNAMMTMTIVVIQITPLAVLFLVLPQILNVAELTDLLGSVGWYTITVMTGLAIHGLIILPLTYLTLTRRNPVILMKGLTDAVMTAFGTSSSTGTMPVTFRCLEENLNIDTRIVRFCIPVGATINMDGTALYEAVAAIFIAQYREVELDFVKVIIIAITSTAASIGAAGIPQAGLVTMVIVLNAVGLPAEDASLILAVDWLIDRFRTILNVLGDSFGAAIVFHNSKKDLEEFDARELANKENFTDL